MKTIVRAVVCHEMLYGEMTPSERRRFVAALCQPMLSIENRLVLREAGVRPDLIELTGHKTALRMVEDWEAFFRVPDLPEWWREPVGARLVSDGKGPANPNPHNADEGAGVRE